MKFRMAGPALRPFLFRSQLTYKYRPDIDGLRAIAVASVVAYHAFPSALRGGYVGVDVFFVISGFLITTLLVEAIETHNFSLAAFYERRVRRIFPALTVCLFAVLAYGSVVLLPSEFAQLGKHVALATTFLSNLGLWYEAGYFDTTANFKPLLHLWSLGIEEQFYIFWPLILWIGFRAKANMVWLLSLLFLTSFSVNVAVTSIDSSSAFYWPISRFWELLAGAALVWVGQVELSSRGRFGLSVAGSAAILSAITAFTPEMRFPGWLALLPVLGASAIILAGPEALANRRFLSHPVLVWIGLISYPLYVWHWPVISFAYVIRQGKPPTPLLAALLVGFSLLLAWATYRFIERPIRFGSGCRALPTAILFGSLGLAGFMVWAENGLPQRFPQLPGIDVGKIAEARMDADFKATSDMTVTDYGAVWVAHLGQKRDRKVVLSGDSVLFHYGPRVQQLAEDQRLDAEVFFVTGPSCPPVPKLVQHDKFEGCAELIDILVDLVRREKIETVVLGASWSGYGSKMIERNGLTFQISQTEGINALYANLEEFVRRLQALGAEVHLVLAVPSHPHFDPARMITRGIFDFEIAADVNDEINNNVLQDVNKVANLKLQEISDRTGAVLLDPLQDICEEKHCSAFFESGKPKFSDGLHLRPVFVRQRLRFLDHLLTVR